MKSSSREHLTKGQTCDNGYAEEDATKELCTGCGVTYCAIIWPVRTNLKTAQMELDMLKKTRVCWHNRSNNNMFYSGTRNCLI